MLYDEKIKNSIKYINDNLDKELNLDDIAKISGFSLSHFYKLFLMFTGFTVKQFIRNKRLARAALELVKTNKRIIDIAFDAGFDSQEVFTRAFASLYDMTPARYRKNRKEILLYEEIDIFSKKINERYNNFTSDIKINVEVMELQEIYLVGMGTYTSIIENIEDDTIPKLWREKFMPRVMEIENTKYTNRSIGYEVTLPKTDTLYHFACLEVTKEAKIPEGMSLKVLPQSQYAIFMPEKPLNPVEYSSLVSFVYGEWLPISGYQLNGDFTFDEYYMGTDNSDGNLKVYVPVK